jgi:hypothetical protein
VQVVNETGKESEEQLLLKETAWFFEHVRQVLRARSPGSSSTFARTRTNIDKIFFRAGYLRYVVDDLSSESGNTPTIASEHGLPPVLPGKAPWQRATMNACNTSK